MTTLDQAARQALEALESAPLDHNSIKSRFFERRHNAIASLRQALEQPKQESEQHESTDVDIALREMSETEDDLASTEISEKIKNELERIRLDVGVSPFVNLTDELIKWVLLAHKRAQQQRKPLTNERWDLWNNSDQNNSFTFAVLVENKLRDKNA